MEPKIEAYRRFVMADPAVQDIIGTAGGSSGTSNARIMIRLKPLAERKISANDVVTRLRQDAPPIAGGALYIGVSQDLDMPRSGSSGSSDLNLLADIFISRKRHEKVSAALQELPELTDVETISDGGTKRVTLKIDREAARRLGVDMQTITQTLNSSFSQRQVATLYERLNQYRVVMELEPQYTEDPSVLEQLHVIGANGQRVPLSAFMRYEYDLIDDRVRHRSQFAAANIGFGLAPEMTLEEAQLAIDQALARIMLPKEIMVNYGGGAQTSQRSLQA